jgi:carbon storage regulator CsrA
MLVLTRRQNERIEIGAGAERIVITVVQAGRNVRLGVDAPAGVPILRPDAKCKEKAG